MIPIAQINKPIYKIAPSGYNNSDPDVELGVVVIDASESYDPGAGPALRYKWCFLRNDGNYFTRIPGPILPISKLRLNFDYLFNLGFGVGKHFVELTVESDVESESVECELWLVGDFYKIEQKSSSFNDNRIIQEGDVAAQTILAAHMSPAMATIWWPNTATFCAVVDSDDVPGQTYSYNWGIWGIPGSGQCVNLDACWTGSQPTCTITEQLAPWSNYTVAGTLIAMGRIPTADVPAASYTVLSGQNLNLIATGSTPGCISGTSYRWNIGTAILYGYSVSLPYDVALAANATNITLTVTSCGGCYQTNSATTTVPLTVGPKAEANGPYTITSSGLRLDGTGSSTLATTRYEWYMPQIIGSNTSFIIGITPSPNSPWTGTFPMSYALSNRRVELKVLYSGLVATDTATLVSEPNCPSIDADYPFSACNLYGQQPPVPSPNGPYEVFKNGNIVWNSILPGLDGTGSYDPDGGIIQRYRWIIDGSWIISDTASIITSPISWKTLRDHPLGVSPDSTHSVTLTVVDDDIPLANITGDALGELSNWSFNLSPPLRLNDMDQTAWFTWYWKITNNGLINTVSIYKDVNKLNLVAMGTGSWVNGGIINLLAQGTSTLTGNVTVSTNANNQDHLIPQQAISYSRTVSAPVNLIIWPARNPSVEINGPFVLAVIPGATYNTSIATDSAHLISTASSQDGDRIVYSWTLSRSDIATINLGTDSTIVVTYDNLHRVLGRFNNANISTDTSDYLITCTVSVLLADVYPGDPTPTSIATTNLTLLNTSPIVVSADSAHLLQWANTINTDHGTVTLNSSGSQDLDGRIDEWDWRIGDDPDRLNQTRISTDTTPTFTWGSVGIVASDTAFSLNLWAKDDDGIWGSDSSVLFYQPNHAPTCSIIGGPYTVLVNNSIQLSGSASDVDANDFITSWEWAVYVNPDTTVLATITIPLFTIVNSPFSSDTTRTYNQLTSAPYNLPPGRTYDLTLTVRDRALAVGTARSQLTIGSNNAPIAVITGQLPFLKDEFYAGESET
jgi:hypothetical protein